ncbi:hypothetical protein GCM10009716_34620 [Streptomyces sodiiphilus]|uniref:DUF4192 domain-containing protein n=1 Tax=Streptomyces sodiiphilus TaxID=226217 RepID=A0ABP5AYN4_9ACTN
MTRPTEPTPAPSRESHRVTLRGPAELADALPYLLGYYPDDSVVLIGLHGRRGRLGGRIRTGIPQSAGDWPELALRLASCLVDNSLARDGRRPDAAVVYLCREPAAGNSPEEVTELLRPLAQSLRTACGALDVPVHEALHLTRTRFRSYCGNGAGTPGNRPPGGGPPWGGTSPMAAAAARAGIRVRGSLRDLERALVPLASPPVVARQTGALDLAATELVPRMLAGRTDCAAVREETLRLAERMLGRFRRVTGPAGTPQGAAVPKGSAEGEDARDDALLTSQDAARLILGLQDRVTRDRAAEWMEGAGAAAALRLWRALARRCVGAYAGHAAAPLTLAGWVAWSTGDGPAARIALSRALEADPDYTFARLLLQACNSGLDPEPLRRCMRRLRADRRP